MRSIATPAEAAEAIFVMLIDEALWKVERVVAHTWEELLELQPRSEERALAPARIDAGVESAQLFESAREQILAKVAAGTRDAAYARPGSRRHTRSI